MNQNQENQLETSMDGAFPLTRGMNLNQRVAAIMREGGPVNYGRGSHRMAHFSKFVSVHWDQLSEFNKRELRENFLVVETGSTVGIYLL